MALSPIGVPTSPYLVGGLGGGVPGFGGPAPAQAGLAQILLQLVGVLAQLAQGWGGYVGPPGTVGGPAPQPGGDGTGYPPLGGTVGGDPRYPLGTPSDPRDFASYLQAQVRGGALQGRTGISQADAIPGTRFGLVQNPQLWQASLARNYAFQFAAFASGNDPLSPQGLAAGAQAFQRMAPEAQLFMQVASVFKGNLLNGPGNYDNPGLRNLLASRGAFDLASLPGVGATDVQTIGAITAAINRGQLSLRDILNSGTIDNLPRYYNIINYVQQGGFSRDVAAYDTVPLGPALFPSLGF